MAEDKSEQESPTSAEPQEDEAHINLSVEGPVEEPVEDNDADALSAEDADSEDPAAVAAGLKDQLLRSLAELENVKRRAARDVENAHKFAIEKLIDSMFPVLDSLEKSVETAESTEGAEAIVEGVTLSLKMFTDTLAKFGVEQIDPLGEPFDPQLHEALTVLPNPDAEPNSVMDVMQKGYSLNGRLVRAAKVIVVKGDS
jgi:molecular chaperone GrpE